MNPLIGRPFTFDRTVRLVLSCGLILAVLLLLRFLGDVLLPFAIASGLAYFLAPVVKKLERFCGRRWLAVLATLALVVICFVVMLGFSLPQVAQELGQLRDILRRVGGSSELAQRVAAFLPAEVWQSLREALRTPQLISWLQEQGSVDLIKSTFSSLAPSFLQVLRGTGQLFSAVMGALLIAMYLLFILLDYPSLLSGAKAMIPNAWRQGTLSFVREFDELLHRYFRAQATIAAIVAVLFYIGFSIVGMPMPGLLGLMMGVLNLVPYMQLIGLLPVAFFALVQALESGSSIGADLFSVLVVLVLVQGVQDIVLVPKITGDASGLSPAVMLLALSVWGKLLGLLGLMLAIPFTCFGLTLYRRWVLATCAAQNENEGDVVRVSEESQELRQ